MFDRIVQAKPVLVTYNKVVNVMLDNQSFAILKLNGWNKHEVDNFGVASSVTSGVGYLRLGKKV